MGIRPLSQSEDLDDHKLVKHAQKRQNISFLGDSTRDVLNKLECKGRDCLSEYAARETLLALWPEVLTDALRTLKRNDPREYVKNDKDINYDSFFNAESLGVSELHDVVKAFADFEPLMSGAAPDRYRDHLAHSFRVWIIGQQVLRDHLGGSLSLDAPGAFRLSDEEWECMWALAALCHDIGYPITQVERINESAKRALKEQGFRSLGDMRYSFSAEAQPFYDTVIRLMSSKVVHDGRPVAFRLLGRLRGSCGRLFGSKGAAKKPYMTHLQNKYYMKFLKSSDKPEHGAISAILMAKSLVYFLESDLCQDSSSGLSKEDARQFLIRREILRAVAAHTCGDIYHLRFNDLSFLLFLVDEIQESGRPTLRERREGEGAPSPSIERMVFQSKNVEVVIRAPHGWKDEVKVSGEKKTYGETVKRRLGRIKRKLRLAVDMPLIDKDMRLNVTVRTQGGEEAVLTLRPGQDGRLGIDLDTPK